MGLQVGGMGIKERLMGNKTRSDWHNGWGGGRKDGVRCPVPHAFPFLFPSSPIQPGSLGMLK